MGVNIKDVAREAGVSIATVSRVLNKKDRVKDSTRESVKNAISKLDFQPDPIARSMIVKESKSVGLLVPTLSNEYWALLAEVIQDELWKYGYTMMLCAMGSHNQVKEEAYLKSFIVRKMDGILWGTFDSRTLTGNPWFENLVQSGIPMVMMDKEMPGIHRVGGDHLQGAMMAVEHLIGLGHTRIAYIHGCPEWDHRELGYRNAHMMYGLPIDENLVVRTQYGIQYGMDAVYLLLKNRIDFSAVFCWNDLTAFGAIRGLEAAGKRVPEDIAVVGYDDISMADVFKPSLTTVRQPLRDIGINMVSLLMESMEKKNTDYAARNVTLQMQLVIRESCGTKIL